MLMAMKTRSAVPTPIDLAVRRALLSGGIQLEPELMPTDRICQRWAVSIGTGLPSDEWDDRRKSLPPPLDDETAMVVDKVILKSPANYRRLIRTWYKTPVPCARIGSDLGLNDAGLYLEWRCSLFYLKREFKASGHGELQRLLEVQV